VYICYDRHFPEGWRALGLAGAEIVFNPSATVAGLSEYLWKLEQPATRPRTISTTSARSTARAWRSPGRSASSTAESYFANPRGQIIAEGSRSTDDVVIADMDLDLIREVRNTWQFYRDRRPETYGPLTAP
jgi:beta-ureidopropionase